MEIFCFGESVYRIIALLTKWSWGEEGSEKAGWFSKDHLLQAQQWSIPMHRQSSRDDPSPLVSTGEATPGELCLIWAPQYKKDTDILESVQ